MARQQLGKALSGGVVALCVILLLTPMSLGQMRAVRQKFTVSGSVGMPGVTIQGLPGAPITDENGVFSAEVDFNATLTITPVKLGYTFKPSSITYEKVKENKTEANFVASLLEFTISGSVGKPGVTMQGLPGNVISDEKGHYSATVSFGFTETVVPTLEGYKFDPPSKLYNQVKENQVQNYKPEELTFTISGTVGAEGVMMKGLPGNPVSNKEFRYTAQVPYNWEGTVTPTKEGHEFTPDKRVYPPVTSPQTDEIYISRVYTFMISGTTNLANVMLKGLPGDPITDTSGYYEVPVEYGWEGTVTPFRAGWTFKPPSIKYAKVTSARENQNYEPSVVQLTISGRAGVAGAVMQGLPGNPTTDPTGFYSAKVEYGWTGDITPVKDGYSFDPPSSVITSLANDMTNTNFKATPITYTISGSVGLKGVVMRGLPGSPVSGADGSYTAKVPYKFSGSVTPTLSGYTFDPLKRDYTEVSSSLPGENYRYSIVQHEVSGRIISESGASVEGIFIRADNDGGSTTTDPNGYYKLSVNHGWRGTITPVKEGYTFTPRSRTLEQIFQPRSNVTFIGKVKMLTITDSIIFQDGDKPEPIEDVLITADPGGATAKTGADGKYRIQVPYGWSGQLIPTKEGFNFYPPSKEYLVPVTADLDNTAPTPAPPATTNTSTTPPATTNTSTTPPATTNTSTTPPATTNTTTTPVDPERQALLDKIDALTQQLNNQGGGTTTDNTLPPELAPRPTNPLGPNQGGAVVAPPTNKTATGPAGTSITLTNVLAWIAKQTGVKIDTDITVKADPVSIDFDINALTPAAVPAALTRLLKDTSYKFLSQDDGSYLVFKPISNQFIGDDLPTALQDIGYAAGVVIVPDANVVGQVYASLDNVPLDTALDTVLAGTPFIVKKTPNYYLVFDKGVNSDQFWKTSVTRHVRLSYITPKAVASQLSKAFSDYVSGNNDPNSRVISVTAPPAIVDRIVEDIKDLDARPRQVILEARVVAMEHHDLLDLGAEWGWPTLQAGVFKSSTSNGGIWAAALGYSADAAFTDSLLLTLNLLQQNEQAEIVAKPVVTAQDGKTSDISVMDEEYYYLTPKTTSGYYTMSEMVTITSGTKLEITPHIGDNNDITLEIATEVSESIPAAAETDLPVVTRRTSRSSTTIKDGGTVALAGLTRTNSKSIESKVPGLGDLPLIGPIFKNKDKSETTQEVAVFVTASIVRDLPDRLSTREQIEKPLSGTARSTRPLTDSDFRSQLENSMASQQ